MKFLVGIFMLLFGAGVAFSQVEPDLRLGIIGLDTSHAIAFTSSLNRGLGGKDANPMFSGVRVVAAYPQGSRDIQSSVKRVPEYTAKVKAMGVEIVGSIDELLPLVDAVLLESNDGRVHLEQLRPVLKAGKKVFIDKPVAARLDGVLAVYQEAAKAQVPVFSSSALRFSKSNQAVRKGSIGEVKNALARSPAVIEPTHSDLFWYGIHGVESLFTAMGTGCVSVRYEKTGDGHIKVTGDWGDGREGVFLESGGYGGKATGQRGDAAIGGYDRYDPLLVEIVKFFRAGVPPVSSEETIEIYAFMAAAEESKNSGGRAVTLESVLAKARQSLGKGGK